MTPEQIASARRVAEDANRGFVAGETPEPFDTRDAADAIFALLAEVERLTAERDEARRLASQWRGVASSFAPSIPFPWEFATEGEGL